MRWIDRLKLAVHAMARPNEIVTSKQLDDWMRFGGTGTFAGVNVNVDNASGLPAVAASVRVLSNALAHLPLRVMRRMGARREPALEHPTYRALHDQPNAWQTSYQLRKLLMRDLLLRGNAYCLKGRNSRGQVASLVRLHPDRITPRQDALSADVIYEFRRAGREPENLSRDDVFHLWADSDDGIIGLNPMQVYREAIGDGIAVREHGSRFFSNGAKLGVVLEQEPNTNMGPEARKALREDFEEMYGGGHNAYRTAMLPGGVRISKPVSISMEDAQWIETRKITSRDIFAIYGIPPHKAGDLADATFSNIQHENLGFLIDSLTPWTVCWEQAIKRDLLDDATLFAKFNTDALLRSDSKSRAETLQIQRRNGVITANEWREIEDRNPRTDPGGDEYIIESNMSAGPDENQDP